MPDIGMSDSTNLELTSKSMITDSSSKVQLKFSSLEKSFKTNDQSGLIIFKHHKNKNGKSKPFFYERKKLSTSHSFDSGLNKSLVDYNAITPKYVTSKFAHPISVRDPSFYRSESREKLSKLEKEFKIDCVAVTFKRHPRGQNIYEPYDPLKDEHCQRYFQSPIVLDVLKKTMPNSDPKIKELETSFNELKTEDFDPVYKNVRSSGYNLLVPYPYTRTNTIMSRHSQLTRSSMRMKGTLGDAVTSSVISSRESSKNTEYYQQSHIRFPPIKSSRNSAHFVRSFRKINSGKTNKTNNSDNPTAIHNSTFINHDTNSSITVNGELNNNNNNNNNKNINHN